MGKIWITLFSILIGVMLILGAFLIVYTPFQLQANLSKTIAEKEFIESLTDNVNPTTIKKIIKSLETDYVNK